MARHAIASTLLRALLCAALASALATAGCPSRETDEAQKNGSSSPESARTSDKQGDDVALAAIDRFIAEQKIDKKAADWKMRLPRPPQVEFDAGKSYFWLLETNVGPIRLRLLPGVAPMHVSSTIYLTRLGFYDDVIFHRVITGFMAQGGDPIGRGTGGPGYQYDGEFDRSVKHDKRGILSMANAGPGTDGSQFFITFLPTPHLDGRHTILGEVVDGMNTLDSLEERGSRGGQTREPLRIESATIAVE